MFLKLILCHLTLGYIVIFVSFIVVFLSFIVLFGIARKVLQITFAELLLIDKFTQLGPQFRGL